MRFNGSFIGPKTTPTTSNGVGSWGINDVFNNKKLNTWPQKNAFEYIGYTAGKVDDTGNNGTISFPVGTLPGHIAVVSINTDDYSNTIKTSIPGWTKVYVSGGQGTFMKVLTESDILSPPSLLVTNDSNAWICYVISGDYNITSAYGIYYIDNRTNPTSSDITVAELSLENSGDIIVFAGAGGKRAITTQLITSIDGQQFDQFQQMNFPATSGIAVREFAFKRFTGGSYNQKVIDFTNTNVNSFSEIVFYIKV